MGSITLSLKKFIKRSRPNGEPNPPNDDDVADDDNSYRVLTPVGYWKTVGLTASRRALTKLVQTRRVSANTSRMRSALQNRDWQQSFVMLGMGGERFRELHFSLKVEKGGLITTTPV